MVKTDLCYQNQLTVVVWIWAFISHFGGTHHTAEDIAICNALPNMQIIAPSEPKEVVEATKYCAYRMDLSI